MEKHEENIITKTRIKDLSYLIVGAAKEVHKHLGPGLLESIYHQCLYDESQSKGLSVLSNQAVPVSYKGKELAVPLRLDLLVDNCIIIELKAVEVIHPVYKAQLLSYMKLAQKPKGLLINLHCENVSKSLIPLVNEYFAQLPE